MARENYVCIVRQTALIPDPYAALDSDIKLDGKSTADLAPKGGTVLPSDPMMHFAVWFERLCTLLLITAVTGCMPMRAPEFAQLSRYDLPGVIASAVAPSSDGTRWLVLNKPDELLVYTSFDNEPAKRTLEGGAISSGWLDEGRVFLAYSELPPEPKGAPVQKVELWNSDLSKRTALITIPVRKNILPGRMVSVSRNGQLVAEDSAVYDVRKGAWLLDDETHESQSAQSIRGEWVLTAGYQDKHVVVRSLTSAAKRDWLAPAQITSAVMTHSGGTVYVGTRSDVFAWPTKQQTAVRFRAGAVVDVQLMDHEHTLAVLGERYLWLLDANTLQELRAFRLLGTGFSLAVDGTLAAVGDEDGRVYVFDSKVGALATQHALSGAVHALGVKEKTRTVVASNSGEPGSTLVVLKVPETAPAQ